MLRITKTLAEPRFVLEGRLIGPWVDELEAVVAAATPGRAHLDLAHVQFVDARGLALLRSLQDQGAVLEAVSPFLKELLFTRPAC